MRRTQPNYVYIDIQATGVNQTLAALARVQAAINAINARRITEVTQATQRWNSALQNSVSAIGSWLAHVALMPMKMMLILEAFRIATFIVDLPKKILRGIKDLVQVGMEYENIAAGLIAITGSAREASDQLRKLYVLAKLPGLTFEDAVKGAQQLQAVKISANFSRLILKEWSNAAALVGQGVVDMDALFLAIRQTATKQLNYGQELGKQFPEHTPFVNKALMALYNTLEPQKLGVTGMQLVRDVTMWFKDNLPRAIWTTQTALENIESAVWMLKGTFAQAFAPTIRAFVDSTTAAVEYAMSIGLVEKATSAFMNGLAQLINHPMLTRKGYTIFDSLTAGAITAAEAIADKLPKALHSFMSSGVTAFGAVLEMLNIIRSDALPAITNAFGLLRQAMRPVMTATVGLMLVIRTGIDSINKLFGHAPGSDILDAMERDIAARLGGDTAKTVMLGIRNAMSGTKEYDQLTNRAILENMLTEVNKPFTWADKPERIQNPFLFGGEIGGALAAAFGPTGNYEKHLKAIKALREAGVNIDEVTGGPYTGREAGPFGNMARSSAETARNTRIIADKIDWATRGYGVSGVEGLLPTSAEAARWASGKNITINVNGAKTFEQMLADLVAQTVGQMHRQGAFAR